MWGRCVMRCVGGEFGFSVGRQPELEEPDNVCVGNVSKHGDAAGVAHGGETSDDEGRGKGDAHEIRGPE